MNYFKKLLFWRSESKLQENERVIILKMDSQSDVDDTLDLRVFEIVRGRTPGVALVKLRGYFEKYFENETLRNEISKLYIQSGDYINAGKYLLLKPSISESEEEYINMYRVSMGDDKVAILKDQIGKNTRSPKGLSSYAKEKLLNLMIEIQVERDLPKFARNWYNHFTSEKIKNGKN